MEWYNGYTAGGAATLEGEIIAINKRPYVSPYAQLAVSHKTLLHTTKLLELKGTPVNVKP